MLTQERRKQLEKNIRGYGWVTNDQLMQYRDRLIEIVEGRGEHGPTLNHSEHLEAVEGMLEHAAEVEEWS